MESENIDGIQCYAPELAYHNEGFPADQYGRLYHSEQTNFWYRARSRILLGLVDKYLGNQRADFIDIGCGTGLMLEALNQFHNLKLYGTEIYLDGLKLARSRLPAVDFFQCDARRLPFEDRFDAIGLFDVIEHIHEDEIVLANAWKALKKGGFIFITVPQHPFLWSANDEAAFHKRRYTRQQILDKISRSRFETLFYSSYVTTLFPLLWLTRHFKRTDLLDPYEAVLRELEIPVGLNAVLDMCMRLDEALIRRGASLPFGGSLCLVARK